MLTIFLWNMICQLSPLLSQANHPITHGNTMYKQLLLTNAWDPCRTRLQEHHLYATYVTTWAGYIQYGVICLPLWMWGELLLRLLCGVYILQSTRTKFNQYSVDPTCPLCDLEPEDSSHVLFTCTSLHDAPRNQLEILSELYPLSISNIFPRNMCEDFENQSQKLIYRLHEARNKLIV
jgi:hypothetical protein